MLNIHRLTEEQRAILRDITAGYTREEIAERTYLSRRQLTRRLATLREQAGASNIEHLMYLYGRAEVLDERAARLV